MHVYEAFGYIPLLLPVTPFLPLNNPPLLSCLLF